VLPVELQRKFGLPSVANGIVYRPERVTCGIVQEVRVPNTCTKIRMVQEVEELGSEFQVRVFRGPESLKDREIKVGVSGPVHLVPGNTEWAEISLPNGRDSRRLNEGRGI
jgi:hypothetical protein